MNKTTMVFDFDIRTQTDNPHQTDTPWGKPVIIGVGDLFEERYLYEERVSVLSVEIERLKALTQWQPIETAPKVARPKVLLWGPGLLHPFVAHFEDNTVRHGWYGDTAQPTNVLEETDITHWMPLPNTPTGEE